MSKIKEYTVTLNTAGSGRATHTTPVLNGHLELIILRPSKPVQIKITLANLFVMYENVHLTRDELIPLRIFAINDRHERMNLSQEKYPLNDELVIEIKGQKQTEVEFIVRYS